ncbi:hypothetical protein CYMTET_28055 [Cymbomonas tetramitiformis]|uniref:EF-hand domain-containing protein n=1 Tax=Cymbomonas tetramitiformis TaxID=36881 RepID=A0AAE0FNR0_9CHLO|nr:hypothetical protein CYMTET_28055 [Cymbomonas tetramitiformis]
MREAKDVARQEKQKHQELRGKLAMLQLQLDGASAAMREMSAEFLAETTKLRAESQKKVEEAEDALRAGQTAMTLEREEHVRELDAVLAALEPTKAEVIRVKKELKSYVEKYALVTKELKEEKARHAEAVQRAVALRIAHKWQLAVHMSFSSASIAKLELDVEQQKQAREGAARMVKRLTEDLEGVRGEVARQTEEIAERDRRIAEMQAEIDQLSEALGEGKAYIQKRDAMIEARHLEIDKLAEEMKQLRAENDDLLEEVDDLREQLKASRTKAGSFDEEMSKAQATIAGLEAKLGALQKSYQALEDMLTKTEKQVLDGQRVIEDLTSKLASLQELEGNFDQQIAEVKEVLKRTQHDRDALWKERKMQEELQLKLSTELRNTRETLEAKVEELEGALSALQSQHDKLSKEHDSMGMRYSRTVNENKDTRTKLEAELDAAKRRVKQLEDDLELSRDAAVRLHHLEVQLSMKESEMITLQEALNELQVKHKTLENTAQSTAEALGKANGVIGTSKEIIESLKAELAELRAGPSVEELLARIKEQKRTVLKLKFTNVIRAGLVDLRSAQVAEEKANVEHRIRMCHDIQQSLDDANARGTQLEELVKGVVSDMYAEELFAEDVMAMFLEENPQLEVQACREKTLQLDGALQGAASLARCMIVKLGALYKLTMHTQKQSQDEVDEVRTKFDLHITLERKANSDLLDAERKRFEERLATELEDLRRRLQAEKEEALLNQNLEHQNAVRLLQAEHQAALAPLQMKQAVLETARNKAEDALRKVQGVNSELETNLASAVNENMRKQQEVEELRSDVDRLKDEIAQLRTQLIQIKTEKDVKIGELTIQVDHLKLAKERFTEEKQIMLDSNAKKITDVRKLKDEVEGLQLQLRKNKASDEMRMYRVSLEDHLRIRVNDESIFKPFPMTFQATLLTVSQILVEKIAADISDDNDPNEARQNLSEFVYDYFMFKLSVPFFAELYMRSLVAALQQHKDADRRIDIFAKLIGAVPGKEPYPEEAGHFLIWFTSNVYHEVQGPVQAEFDNGKSDVDVEVAQKVARQTLDKALERHRNGKATVLDLIASISKEALNEGGSMVFVNYSSVLGLAFDAYMRAYHNVEAMLQDLFVKGDTNKDGKLTFQEFSDIVRSVDPDMTDHIIKKMFRVATQRSPTGSDNAMSPLAFASVAREFGLCFIKGQPPLFPIPNKTAIFDEFPLLNDSWIALKKLIADIVDRHHTQVTKGEEKLVLQAGADDVINQMKSLEDILKLNDRATLSAAWTLVRRIFLFVQVQMQRDELTRHETSTDASKYSSHLKQRWIMRDS